MIPTREISDLSFIFKLSEVFHPNTDLPLEFDPFIQL